MGLTANQKIEKKPEEKSEWSVRKLFPFAAMASTLSKVFVNPFEVLAGVMVLVAGIGELFGRNISWLFYVILILVLAAAFALRFLHKDESK